MLAATAVAIFVIPALFVIVERIASRPADQAAVAAEPKPTEGGA